MLIVVKIRNAGELLWESLDGQERAVLMYAAAWLVIVLFAGARRRERDRLKAELLEELAAGGGVRS